MHVDISTNPHRECTYGLKPKLLPTGPYSAHTDLLFLLGPSGHSTKSKAYSWGGLIGLLTFKGHFHQLHHF